MIAQRKKTSLFSARLACSRPAGHILVTPAELHHCRNRDQIRVGSPALWDHPWILQAGSPPPPPSENVLDILWRTHAQFSVDMLRVQHRPRFDLLPHQVIWRQALRFLWVHEQCGLDVSRWKSLQSCLQPPCRGSAPLRWAMMRVKSASLHHDEQVHHSCSVARIGHVVMGCFSVTISEGTSTIVMLVEFCEGSICIHKRCLASIFCFWMLMMWLPQRPLRSLECFQSFFMFT